MAKTLKERNQMECNIRARKKYNEKYNKEMTSSILIRISKITEADLLEKLNSVDNKAGYIKRLIREDIEKENKSLETRLDM